MRSHKRQPTRLPVPGILQARTLEWVAISFSNAWKWKVKSESEVPQSFPTLSDTMDCSLPGSSVHGIFQAIVLECIAISFSRGSSQPRDRTWVFLIVSRCFIVGVTFKTLLAYWTGEGNSTPFQYTCLENPLDGEEGRIWLWVSDKPEGCEIVVGMSYLNVCLMFII